jgi:DNA helicase-2/ATP-dependent DNA helicase PcrA
LEQNYRSTRNIVGAANSLIEKNTRQIPKKIYSENEDGARISLKHAFSDVEEVEIVSNEISRLVRKEHLKYEQIAILYRTNSQSRIFEEALRKHAIPYRIYGGFSFYDQKLIKDILAYFRLIVNANDEEAFKRIVNYPTRGIGSVTINKVLQAASEHQVGVWKVMQSPRTFGVDVNNGTLSKLNGFYDLIERFRDSHVDACTLGVRVLKESGIMQEAYKDTSLESKEVQDNLSEVLNGMSTFVSMQRETGDERIYMSDYLSEVALLSDTDDQETEGEDRVTMMTVHSSKGLEFDAVFIVGME